MKHELLVDAAVAPSHDDLDLLRARFRSAIPAMVAVSKADLLSEPDRTQFSDYLKREVAAALEVDRLVGLVSVVGPAASLARSWFETELAPLFERARELRDASARRKLASLRKAVIASLGALQSAAERRVEEDAGKRRAKIKDPGARNRAGPSGRQTPVRRSGR